jgi:predicted AAA+ superfamily ATPase
MDPRFSPHNTHLEAPEDFSILDPHLRLLKRLPLVHRSDLLAALPNKVTGIFTVTGGRQVGKTTLLKQWMALLIGTGVNPACIAYVTGELIDDHHSLVRILTSLLDDMPSDGFRYVIVDEVTYIREWDKGIKYMADAALLEDTALMLTGSDTLIIRESRMRLPGRRGMSDTVDFHLYPLNFYEAVKLKAIFTPEEIALLAHSDKIPPPAVMDSLFNAFDDYLRHGGFLMAINDLSQYGRILPATFATYSDWIRGDVIKRRRNEASLREILAALINRYGSQVTWNDLARDLSIDHPKTVIDYIGLLVSMDVVFVQPALREEKMSAAPKKAKKVMFTDPFIFHAVHAWLYPHPDPFAHMIAKLPANENWSSKLTEACAATLYQRKFPTYYIKAAGEVDIAYVSENRFWPVEVKWTRQLRPKSLKQISKYPNAKILTKRKERGEISGVATEPLPLALLRLGAPSPS